jgi:hypothetical protein
MNRWITIAVVASVAACSSSAPTDDSGSAGETGGGVPDNGTTGTGGSGGTAEITSPDAGSSSSGSGGRPSSGGAGTANQGGAGGSAGTSGVADSGAPHVVKACPSGSGAGVWENVTPSQLDYTKWCTPQWNTTCPGPGETSASGKLATYGTNAIVIDPANTATVYMGTSSLGLWKTTDCGATWAHINTGANGTKIDQGRNWSMVIDPTDTQVLYTTAGYGVGDVFKTTNGGVDWQPMLTPDVKTVLAGGFVEKITMDPTNHLHLLASAHGACNKNGMMYGCLAESPDGGKTWSLTNSAESWSEGDGQTMVNATTWFFGSLFVGIWRTTNAGAAWTQVFKGNAAGDLYVGSDGTFYVCGLGAGVLHSTDGVAWSPLPKSPACGGNSNGGGMIAGDGKTMFISNGSGGQAPTGGWYYSATDPNPATWTSLRSPTSMSQGGISIAYDRDHHILYSSNYIAGMWRLVVQ